MGCAGTPKSGVAGVPGGGAKFSTAMTELRLAAAPETNGALLAICAGDAPAVGTADADTGVAAAMVKGSGIQSC